MCTVVMSKTSQIKEQNSNRMSTPR